MNQLRADRRLVTRSRVGLTVRDRAVIDSVLRLGAATSSTLQSLHAPGIDPRTFRRRLRRLTEARWLNTTGRTSRGGALFLYLVGPAALAPGQERPWAPSLNQLAHTLAVEDALLQLLAPNLAPGIAVTDWEGEAELRGWVLPGHPRPDLRIHWRIDPYSAEGACGRLEIEVDRGTESSPVWRRKLTRYLTYQPSAVVLAVTTSDKRARNIAEIALGIGVCVLTLDASALAAGCDPIVYDTRGRRRYPLSQALTTTRTTGEDR